MKRIARILLCILAMAWRGNAQPVGNVGSNTLELTFRFAPQEIGVEKYRGYDLMRFRGCHIPETPPGTPTLPVRFAVVQLPVGAQVTGVSSASEREVVVLRSIRPWPAQPPVPTSVRQVPPFVPLDPSIRGSPRPFPLDIVERQPMRRLRGQSLLPLRIAPIRYIPATGEIRLAQVVRVSIAYALGGAFPAVPAVNRAFFRDRANRLSANAAGPEPSSIATTEIPATNDYLIVTKAALTNAFAALAAHRRLHNGYAVDMVTTESIASRYAGAKPSGGSDLQTKIRECIADYVQGRGTMFVVLGGDDTCVPVRRCFVTCGSYTENNMPTDLYYAGLDGTWDADADGVYGETKYGIKGIEDEADLYADVMLGRIPVRTEEQALAYIGKVVAYETAPPTSLLKKYMMAGHFLWNSYSGDSRPTDALDDGHPQFCSTLPPHPTVSDGEIWIRRAFRDFVQPSGWEASASGIGVMCDTLTTWDTAQCGDYSAGDGHLLDRLNEGWNVMVMDTHGATTQWAGEGGFYSSDALSLTGAVNIVYTIACLTGGFDSGEPSLSEAFLRNPAGGALLYLGSSRYNWGSPGSYYGGTGAAMMGDFLRRTFGQDRPLIGEVFDEHKEAVAGNAAYNGSYRWVYFGLNLQGDPAIHLAGTDKPFKLLSDKASLRVTEGQTNSFHLRLAAPPPQATTVTVSRVSGDPDILVTTGASLLFPTNAWSAWRTVTLSARKDEDKIHGTATVLCEAPGLPSFSLVATEYDLDDSGAINFDRASMDCSESGYWALVTVRRTGGGTGQVSVRYATVDGSAKAGEDYHTVTGTLSWPDGATNVQYVSIRIVDDLKPEGNETFAVRLSDPTGGAVLGANSNLTIRILANDPNNAPSARIVTPAARTISVPTNAATLRMSGLASDDGKPYGRLAFAWTRPSGNPSASFSDPASNGTRVALSGTGVAALRFTADDGDATGFDQVFVRLGDPPPEPTNGLALWLTLDEGSGSTALDASGLANHGERIGPPAWTNGRLGGAMAFLASTQSYVRVADADSLDGTNKITFAFWLRPLASDGNARGVLAKRFTDSVSNAFSLFVKNGRLYVDLDSSNNRFAANAAFQTGVWHHAAVVYDGAASQSLRARLYVNGVLDRTAAESSATLPNSAADLRIGTLDPQRADETFNGVLDDVRIYRRALSAEEIGALAFGANRAPCVEAGPIGVATVGVSRALEGRVSDDGNPAPPALAVRWTQVSGPGNVVIDDAAEPGTLATFSASGTYVLRLDADDGEVDACDDVTLSAVLPGAGVTVVESDGSTQGREGDATGDDYYVRLNTAPTQDVVIAARFDASQIDVAPTNLTFGATNWSVVQRVRVLVRDDAEIEGPHRTVISHSASSADAVYDGIGIASVVVSIADNETNHPPVAEPDWAVFPEDCGPVVLNVLTNDWDPDGHALTLVAAVAGHGGQVALGAEATNLVHVADPHFCGTNFVRYVVTDGRSAYATGWVAVTVTPVADVFYVNREATGVSDGTSWSNAFTDLQAALALARTEDEVWVAKGNYRPTGGVDRKASFAVADGVAVWGGFQGWEATKTQRSGTRGASVLSGDIGLAGVMTDNCYHVVAAGDGAVLDGFSVVDGYADNRKLGTIGAAGNQSYIRYDVGGGVYGELDARCLRLSNMVFSNDFAQTQGGAVYVDMGCSVAASNCLFAGNASGYRGGAIGAWSTSSLVVVSSAFRSNRSAYGGAIGWQGKAQLQSSVFDGNEVTGDGGAVSLMGIEAELTCSRCAFASNRAVFAGGAIAVSEAERKVALVNCAFAGNEAAGTPSEGGAGGAVSLESVPGDIFNCTFFANRAGQRGHGGALRWSCWFPPLYQTVVRNSILWDRHSDQEGEIWADGPAGSGVLVSYCALDGGVAGIVATNGVAMTVDGILDGDPRFVDASSPAGTDGTWLSADDGLRVKVTSLCVDGGLSTTEPADDILGTARPQGSEVDIGAYERIPDPGDADNDGIPDEWENLYGTTDLFGRGRDWDGDGLSDRDEYLSGTIPTNGRSLLEVVAISNSLGHTLFFDAVTGRIYSIDQRDDLLSNTWESLPGSAIAPSFPGRYSVMDTNEAARRFYRIRVVFGE